MSDLKVRSKRTNRGERCSTPCTPVHALRCRGRVPSASPAHWQAGRGWASARRGCETEECPASTPPGGPCPAPPPPPPPPWFRPPPAAASSLSPHRQGSWETAQRAGRALKKSDGTSHTQWQRAPCKILQGPQHSRISRTSHLETL